MKRYFVSINTFDIAGKSHISFVRIFVNCLSALCFMLCASSMCAQNYVGKIKIEEGNTQKYNSVISFRGNELTGICLLRSDGQQILGSMVNEFGIKAMDFIYHSDTRKVKLLNVVKFLNKWYIRKILKADLSYMLGARDSWTDKHRILRVQTDGSLQMENIKYKLTYNLSPIQDETKE